MHRPTHVLVKQLVQEINGRWWVSSPVAQPEIAEGILHVCVDRSYDAVTLRVPLNADRATLRAVVRDQLDHRIAA